MNHVGGGAGATNATPAIALPQIQAPPAAPGQEIVADQQLVPVVDEDPNSAVYPVYFEKSLKFLKPF